MGQAWAIDGDEKWVVVQGDPWKVLHLVPKKMLELGGGGKHLINPLPNLGCPLLVVAPDEFGFSVKVNQAQVIDKLSKIFGVNNLSVLPTAHLLVRSYNIVDILDDERKQTLYHHPGDLRSKYPLLPMLGAHVHFKWKLRISGLLEDD